jgi:hypothetical protein
MGSDALRRGIMRFRFDLSGDAYSKEKEAFKRILAKHGLRWQGTLERPLWAGRTERVTAEFERDTTRDRLVRAVLVWAGTNKSALLEELKSWAWEVGGKVEEEKSPGADEVTQEVETALRFWDVVYKPNEGWLEAQGRPKAWIEQDMQRWKQTRRARQRELTGQALD